MCMSCVVYDMVRKLHKIDKLVGNLGTSLPCPPPIYDLRKINNLLFTTVTLSSGSKFTPDDDDAMATAAAMTRMAAPAARAPTKTPCAS